MENSPNQGLNISVPSSGQAVITAPANTLGGYIVNPATAIDQDIATAEPLYVDVVGQCAGLQAYGTIVALQPGERFDVPYGSTNPVYHTDVDLPPHQGSRLWPWNTDYGLDASHPRYAEQHGAPED